MGRKKLLNPYEQALIARYEQSRHGLGDSDFTEEEIVELYDCYRHKYRDYHKASELLDWGLLFYPSSTVLYGLLADLDFEERNFPAVICTLKKSLSLDPYNRENWLYLYEAYLNDEEHADEDFFWGERGFRAYLHAHELASFYHSLIKVLQSYAEHEKALFLYLILLELEPDPKYIPEILLYTYKFRAYARLQDLLQNILDDSSDLKPATEQGLLRALAFTYYYTQQSEYYRKILSLTDSLLRLQNLRTKVILNLNYKLVLEIIGLDLADFLNGVSKVYSIDPMQYGLLRGVSLLWEGKYSECRNLLRPLLAQNSKLFVPILYLIIDSYREQSGNLLKLLDKYQAALSPKQYLHLLTRVLNIYTAQGKHTQSIVCYRRLLQLSKGVKRRGTYHRKLINALILNQEYNRARKQISLAQTECQDQLFSLYPIAIDLVTGKVAWKNLHKHSKPDQNRILAIIRDLKGLDSADLD